MLTTLVLIIKLKQIENILDEINTKKDIKNKIKIQVKYYEKKKLFF